MIVVTAPTSQIGSQLLAHLLDGGAPVRVIARDPAKLDGRTRERVEVVQGSHRDPDVVNEAFRGADTVFWLVPADPRSASLEDAYVGFSRPACQAFRSQGVKRVVAISALGRGTPLDGRAGHVTASLAMDDLIAVTGVALRVLTMPSFMDNFQERGPRQRRAAHAGGHDADGLPPVVRAQPEAGGSRLTGSGGNRSILVHRTRENSDAFICST